MQTGYRFTPQLVVGLIIIGLGVIFTLDHLEVLNAGEYLKFWPVLLIVYGISRMYNRREGHGRLGGLFFLGVGILFLLGNLDVVEFSLWDLWPIVLLVVGSMLVWRATGGHRERKRESAGVSEDMVNTFIMFGGVERRNSSKNFRGGEITVIMGGCELDLRGASMADGEAVIDVFTLWGGIDIKVPADWTVTVEGMPLMGGCEDKTRHEAEGTSKHLIIKGYVVMGGLEIGH